MPDCQLCRAYIHDHLHTSASITFKKYVSRVKSSPAFASDIVKEVTRVLGDCITYSDFYMRTLERCATMEATYGRESTKEVFFNTCEYMQTLTTHIEYTLFDIGAGKMRDIAAWTQEHIYFLFGVLLQVHKEHTRAVQVQNLGPPLLYAHAAPVRETLETVVILQELLDDDLYA